MADQRADRTFEKFHRSSFQQKLPSWYRTLQNKKPKPFGMAQFVETSSVETQN